MPPYVARSSRLVLLLAAVAAVLAPASADEDEGADASARAVLASLPPPTAGAAFALGGEIERTGSAAAVGRYDFSAEPAPVGDGRGWRLRDQLNLGATVLSAEALVRADLSPVSGTVLVANGQGVTRITWERTPGGFGVTRSGGAAPLAETLASQGTALTTISSLLLLARELPAAPTRFASHLWRPASDPRLAPVEIVVETPPDGDVGRRLVVTSPDLGLTASFARKGGALVALRLEGLAEERNAVLETRIAPRAPWMEEAEALRAIDERLGAGDPEGALALARERAAASPGPVAEARLGLLCHDALAVHLDDPAVLEAYAREGRSHLERALAAEPPPDAGLAGLLEERHRALGLLLGERGGVPSSDPAAAAMAAAERTLGTTGATGPEAVLAASGGRFVTPAFDTVGVVTVLERFLRRPDGGVDRVGMEAAGRGGLYARVHPYRLAVEPAGDGQGWRAVDVVGEGESETVSEVRLDASLAPVHGSLRLRGTFADPAWTPSAGAVPAITLRWRRVGAALLVSTEEDGAVDPPRILPAPDAPWVVGRAQAVLLARLGAVTGSPIGVLAWDPPTPDRPEHWAAWRLEPAVEGWDGWGAHVALARSGSHERVEIALDLTSLALVGFEHRGEGIATERWLRLPYVPPEAERADAGRRMLDHMEDLPPGLSQGLVLLRRGVALLGGESAALWEALGDVQLSLSADPDRPVPARERVRLALGAADAFELSLDAPGDREGHDPVSIDYRLAQAFVRAGDPEAAEAVATRIEKERGAPQVAAVLRSWIARVR